MKYKTVIGILAYNVKQNPVKHNIIYQCIDSIYKYTNFSDAHFIVANNSEDEQVIKDITDLCANRPNLTLLNFGKNLGTSAAWNVMTRHYDNDITVILNDDIMVYPYWLEITKFVLENNPDIATVSYDMWYTQNPYDFRVPQNANVWANETIYPLGAAFAFRREVFEIIGGLDEKYYMSLEEADFGLRLVKAGYFNYVVGTSNEKGINEYHLVRHVGSASGGYQSNTSGDVWKQKHNLPFPLNPDIEERLKRERNKSINLVLPKIINGNVKKL